MRSERNEEFQWFTYISVEYEWGNVQLKAMENLPKPILIPALTTMNISPFGTFNFPKWHQQKFFPQHLYRPNQLVTGDNITTPNAQSTSEFYQRMFLK